MGKTLLWKIGKNELSLKDWPESVYYTENLNTLNMIWKCVYYHELVTNVQHIHYNIITLFILNSSLLMLYDSSYSFIYFYNRKEVQTVHQAPEKTKVCPHWKSSMSEHTLHVGYQRFSCRQQKPDTHKAIEARDTHKEACLYEALGKKSDRQLTVEWHVTLKFHNLFRTSWQQQECSFQRQQLVTIQYISWQIFKWNIKQKKEEKKHKCIVMMMTKVSESICQG